MRERKRRGKEEMKRESQSGLRRNRESVRECKKKREKQAR